MTRLAVYLTVALAAFGAGIHVAVWLSSSVNNFSLNLKNTNNKEIGSFQNTTGASFIEKQRITNKSTPEIKLTCGDKNLRPVWEFLKAQLEEDYASLKVETDCASFFEIEKKVDLNFDGKTELLVQGVNLGQCSAVGNCSFFVFSKNKTQYEPLLIGDIGSVQQIEVAKTVTNKYKDLILKSHDSWNTGSWNVYKFDGKQYKANECYEYEYKDKKGEILTSAPPTLTQHRCLVE